MVRRTLMALMLVLLPVLADASQSLSAGTGTGTLPAGAPWTNLANFRIQFRLHNWSYNNSYRYIYSSDAYAVELGPTNSVVFVSWRDSSLSCRALNLPGGTDTIFQFQRDIANHRLICDAFSTATGALLYSETVPIVNPGIPNDSGARFSIGPVTDIAYLRTYSSVVPPRTVPGNKYDGTLLDLEMEGSGQDRAGHANLTMSAASYTTTPEYPPAAILNSWPAINTFRAGTGLQLSAAGSFSATDNATLSYFWQQMEGGPMKGIFSSRTDVDPVFIAALAGTYTLQVTVTDSAGRSSAAQAPIGAVATDSNGIVITGLPPAMDGILGPLTMAGTSPWIYYDLTEIASGSSVAAAALANPPALGTPLSGTVSLTSAPTALVGTGTHFTTELSVDQQIIVAWDSIDGPGTGRHVDSVQSIVDDTHATLRYWDLKFPNPSAATVYLAPPNTPSFQLNWWVNGYISTFWTFYDAPLALYRLYYRTGNVAYLTQARQLADYNWEWMLDHGAALGPPPRGAGIISQFFRALDGHPERFQGLYNVINFYNDLRWNSPANVPDVDLREAGYTQWFMAVGSQVDTDPTRHAQYCSWLNTYTPQWISTQYPQGYWGENVYGANSGYPSPPFSTSPLQFGASPWRMSMLVKGLEATYDALNDPQNCNNMSLAASLLPAIENVVAWQWNYGRDSNNRGIYYDVQYPGNSQIATFPAGTISVDLSSTVVRGSGTAFTTAFRCNGTDFIGIANTHTAYKVASCQDNTHLTITPAFGAFGQKYEPGNVTGSPFAETPPASTNCGTSLASYCYTGTGDLNLDRLLPGEVSWLYNKTGDIQYKMWADDFFSAAFGGPATGPDSSALIGTTVSNPSGPNALGYIGDSIIAVPDCNAPSPAPCTPGGNVFANLGKNFGEASGAPGADNALAWRLNGISPPVIRIFYLDTQLASVHDAAKVRIAVTQPSGAVVTQTCSTPSCAVSVDVRQGTHLVQKTYLSAAGDVLATGDPTVLAVEP